MKTERRNFLSMMAAVPLATSFGGWINPISSKKIRKVNAGSENFYVWVHGIFGITYPASSDKDRKTLVLATPAITSPRNKHVYKIGRVEGYDNNKHQFIGQIQDIDVATYRIDLGGFTPPDATQFDTRETMKMQKPRLIDKQPDIFYFRLPLPTAILPLRFISLDVEPQDQKLPDAPDGGLSPVVHVLQYDGVQATNVTITKVDSQGNTPIPFDQSYNHVHIFAEEDPDCMSEDCHNFNGSLGALLSCYKNATEFVIRAAGDTCAPLNNILNFCDDLTEQFFLMEWKEGCRTELKTDPLQGGTVVGHQCPQLLIIPQSAAKPIVP